MELITAETVDTVESRADRLKTTETKETPGSGIQYNGLSFRDALPLRALGI